MTSTNQVKNMQFLRGAVSERCALIKRLRNLDQDIAQVNHAINDDWASHFEEPNEQVDDDSTDEYGDYECDLRKRKTKKIGKSLMDSRHKETRYTRSKKLAQEARSRKRSHRSKTQSKGERDFDINASYGEDNKIGTSEVQGHFRPSHKRLRLCETYDPTLTLQLDDSAIRENDCIWTHDPPIVANLHAEILATAGLNWIDQMNKDILALTANW